MTQQPINHFEKHNAATIIQRLEPYVTPQRQKRIQVSLNQRLGDIHLAMEATSDMHNALAAVRSAEALGIVHIHFIAPEGDAKSLRSVTQGAHHWVCMHYYDDFLSFAAYLQKNNITCAGAVVTNHNTSLGELAVQEPLCVLLGNEQRGLSVEATRYCNTLYAIPMHGFSESLNLSVSAAISLYDITQRKRALLPAGVSGNLTHNDTQILQARYYMHTLQDRLVNGLLYQPAQLEQN